MTLRELELKVAGWLREVPHLPISAQTWLASNVWWLALVGGIVSAITAVVMVIGLIVALPLLSFAIFFGVHGIWWLIKTLIALVFVAAAAIILLDAYQPLRRLAKKGWVLLFLLLLINVVSTAVGALTANSV